MCLKSWAVKVIFFLLNHIIVQELTKQCLILIGLGSLINYAKPDQLIICASLGIKKNSAYIGKINRYTRYLVLCNIVLLIVLIPYFTNANNSRIRA
jgi:hypothetical protein